MAETMTAATAAATAAAGGGGVKNTNPLVSATFLTPAETKILVLLSASVARFGVPCMRDFYINKDQR